VTFFQRRYEECLNSALKQLAPVITVGRPGDSFGFAGAARFYVANANWQRAVRYFLTHSAAVVITIGRGDGLWWEIKTALETVPHEKLLFVLPVVGQQQSDTPLGIAMQFIKQWNTLFVSKRTKTERLVRYQSFRKRTSQLFRERLPVDLGNALWHTQLR